MLYKSFAVLGVLATAAVATALLHPATASWFDARAELAALEAQLAESEAEIQFLLEDNTELQLALAKRERALTKVQDQNRQLAEALNAQPAPVLCCMDGNLTLHFRSDSAEIEPMYDAALVDFAEAVSTLPGAVVEISGHADRRGERESNLTLSQERVHAVQERLRSLGLREVAFHTTANGAAAPITRRSDEESAFFERRVELRLVSAGSQQISMR